MKRWLRIAVTLLLCALLLVYVADIESVLATLGNCDPVWALIAVAALLLDRILMSYKWGLLLAIRGYSVSLAKRLMVYCSAMMWGLALPSTVGADGIRVVLVGRFGVRVDDTLATILVERGIGFIVALLTTVASLIILRTMLPHDAIYDYFLLFGVAGLLDGIGVYEGIFVAIMALGGVRPADALAVSLAARAFQIVVWLPWWLMLAAQVGVRPPVAVTAPARGSSS